MKKAFLLVCILTISVITTACINNFAVQELNNKAMNLMQEGNYTEAIERLKSSIDLDDSIFESHYNLAVAYTKSEDYANAMKAYQKAIGLKPEFADSYYSLAVTEENLASDINAGLVVIDENGNPKKPEFDPNEEKTSSKSDEVSLTDAEKIYLVNLYKDAVKNYNLYLSKGKDINDTDEVKKRISDLEAKIDPVDLPQTSPIQENTGVADSDTSEE